jgi:hypothetical protein
MAESRLLELEITEGTFGPMFSDEQHARMKQQIDELRQLTEQALDKNAAPNNSFNRSGISLDFIRKIEGLIQAFPPG